MYTTCSQSLTLADFKLSAVGSQERPLSTAKGSTPVVPPVPESSSNTPNPELMREILWYDNGTTGLTLKVDALVNGNSVHAVLDTVAQASVLSWSWVEKNDISISDGVNVMLKGPTPDVTFQATLVKQVSIQLGRTVRFCDLYVANISDDMLLGLDILKLFRLSIDLANDVVTLPDGIGYFCLQIRTV